MRRRNLEASEEEQLGPTLATLPFGAQTAWEHDAFVGVGPVGGSSSSVLAMLVVDIGGNVRVSQNLVDYTGQPVKITAGGGYARGPLAPRHFPEAGDFYVMWIEEHADADGGAAFDQLYADHVTCQ